MPRLALSSLLLITLVVACGTVPSATLAPDASVTIPDGATTTPDLAPPIPPGSPRIVQRVWTGSDGSKVTYPEYLMDTKEGMRCYPTDAEPSVVRCLPTSYSYYFKDAACTQPYAYVTKDCAVDKYVMTMPPSSTICKPAQPTVYRVGPTIIPSKLYMNVSSGCVDASVNLGTVLATTIFYDTTGPVPLSTFMAGSYGY